MTVLYVVTLKPADGRLRYFMSDETDSHSGSCRLKCKISDNEFFVAAPWQGTAQRKNSPS